MIVDLKQAQIPSRVELLISRIYILMCSRVPIVNIENIRYINIWSWDKIELYLEKMLKYIDFLLYHILTSSQ